MHQRPVLRVRPVAWACLLATTPMACGDDGGPLVDDDTTAGESQETGLEESSGPSSNTVTDTSGDPDAGSSEDDSTTAADTTDGESTDEGTTGEPGPALGDTPNALCEGALLGYAAIVAENDAADPDPAVFVDAYLGADAAGTPLQDFVQIYGAFLGRVDTGALLDDQAILDLLAGTPTSEDLIEIETRLDLVMSLVVRRRTNDVSNAPDDAARPPELLYAEWDDAWCYWDGALRALAVEADAEGLEVEPIIDDIEYGFEWGHTGVEGPDAPWAIDAFVLPPAKQIVEKSMFRSIDRLILKYAQIAVDDDDILAARRALGYFQLVEDRLTGLNTPGIAIIESQLSGDPGSIDVAEIALELDTAWSKRTRNYTDQAIAMEQLGTAGGVKGAWEGRTYSKVTLPRIVAAMPEVDPSAHLQLWDDYRTAIEADDLPAAEAASAELVTVWCDYQALLGIAACTGTADEPG